MPPATATPPPPGLQVAGLIKAYGNRRGAVEAVAGIDLTAPRGALTALLGPNGAGKTTTIECCVGLRRPDGGTVRVLGLDPHHDRSRLRPRVGVMLQDGGLPSTVPAAEALRHLSRMYAAPRDLAELGARLGLDGFARTQVRRLSGGERQRLALAAAVVGRPDVLFLDEPSAGMDPQSRLAVWDLVRELRADGTTIVLTTHAMAEAEELADHVVVLDRGRVIAAGTTAELVAGHDAVRLTLRAHDGRDVVLTDLAVDLEGLLTRTGSTTGGPVRVEASSAPGSLAVHAPPDPALLHTLTGWAAERGLLVTALTTGARTLEDVFLDLTGRSLR